MQPFNTWGDEEHHRFQTFTCCQIFNVAAIINPLYRCRFHGRSEVFS